jgi:hypothetical protein
MPESLDGSWVWLGLKVSRFFLKFQSFTCPFYLLWVPVVCASFICGASLLVIDWWNESVSNVLDVQLSREVWKLKASLELARHPRLGRRCCPWTLMIDDLCHAMMNFNLGVTNERVQRLLWIKIAKVGVYLRSVLRCVLYHCYRGWKSHLEVGECNIIGICSSFLPRSDAAISYGYRICFLKRHEFNLARSPECSRNSCGADIISKLYTGIGGDTVLPCVYFHYLMIRSVIRRHTELPLRKRPIIFICFTPKFYAG